MFKYFISSCLIFFLLACQGNRLAVKDRPQTLTTLLQSLSSDISQKEAARLADDIDAETNKLREKFDPVSEPHLNNFLIIVGVKEQGLCYQWSDALYAHFKNKNYPHFTFHLLVSDKGQYFSEHNVMVVSAKGKSVMEGVIIDPWRNPGALYVSKVKDDSGYRWKRRKEREI